MALLKLPLNLALKMARTQRNIIYLQSGKHLTKTLLFLYLAIMIHQQNSIRDHNSYINKTKSSVHTTYVKKSFLVFIACYEQDNFQ